jgi:hypothetical protein
MMDKTPELQLLRTRLRNGTILEEEIYHVVHRLGEAGFIEAKPEIEALLMHEDPQIRFIALNVLTLHWMCSEHRNTCEAFILYDADIDNRRLGISGLGALLEGTKDAKALELLLNIFHNDEEWILRDRAYSSILYILGKPETVQPPATRRLDYEKDVNWKWIKEAEEIVRRPNN